MLDFDWEKENEDEDEKDGDGYEGTIIGAKTEKDTHSPRRPSVLEDGQSNLQTKKRCISFIQPDAMNGLQFPVPIYSVKLVN